MYHTYDERVKKLIRLGKWLLRRESARRECYCRAEAGLDNRQRQQKQRQSMKLSWSLLALVVVLAIVAVPALGSENENLWEEDDKEILVRTIRGTKDRGANGSPSCRYTKGQWSECDPKSNMRSRSLTLKKGDKTCEQSKTITKKCKKGKACRYEKGNWSNCVNNNMVRVDNLKANSDFSCEKTRRITKKCKPDTNIKKASKDRSNKKNGKQQ
uniref:Pleiotrophin/Midkine C-terminal domain-containing protein n=1 Tax=Trichogramma kaykai TaxID=54128 RepID=A0ABD2VWS3_9HYME